MSPGPPMSVASSIPITLHVWNVPSGRRALMSPLYSGIAQSTPSMPRTRSNCVSCIGLMSSTNCTFESITQMSGCCVSAMNPYVRVISPTKIDACCVMSSDANVIPMMMPRYFARSPISIFSAT